jgi:nucleoside-diphosphate-sugar epimerase
VRALVRDPAKGQRLLDCGAELSVGDLTSPPTLARAVNGASLVVHLAAVADSSDAALNEAVNVDGTAAMAEAALAAGVDRFVNVSTTCAGRTLRDTYSETKLRAERVLDSTSLAVTHLRPTMIYGRGSKEWDLFVRIVRTLPVVPIPGSGRSTLRPVYVEDMLDIVGRVLDEDGAIGRTYDVAGPASISTRELVELVGRAQGLRRRALGIPARPVLLGARLLGRITERPVMNVDQVMAFLQDTIVDIQPARAELGWDPRPLEEGLAELFGGEL